MNAILSREITQRLTDLDIPATLTADMNKSDTILQAVKAIASQCDGAVATDGVGFNGLDTRFGKSLAKKSTISPLQAIAAHKMLRKYRVQLRNLGIEYDDLEPPELPVRETWGLREIKKVNGNAVIEFDYDAELVSLVKKLPGRKFDGKTKSWKVPLKGHVIDMLVRFAVTQEFTLDEEIEEIFKDRLDHICEMTELSMAEDGEIPKDVENRIGGTLRPFQKAAVNYALKAKRCFIADEMGLGKTVESLVAIECASSFPLIVVCPAVVKWNWTREIAKWLPHRSFERIDGRYSDLNTPRTDSDVYVINWDILESWEDWLLELEANSVIFDESHYAKNYKAKRTKSAKRVGKESEYVFCLSGTPVLNCAQELISQLQLMNRLDDFGGFWPFAFRYCGARQLEMGDKKFWDFSRSLHMDELNRTMRATCYIRRLKKDVLDDLPDKQRTEIMVPIRNRKEYDKAESNFINWIGEQAVEDEQWLASIEDMDPDAQMEAIDDRRSSTQEAVRKAEYLVKLGKLRQIALDGKLDNCVEWISNLMESTGEKVVVFTWHKVAAKRIAHVFGCNMITGETSHAKRDEYVVDFQGNDDTRMIVCNIRAGGVGITLTAASTSVFLEMDWTPGGNDQAEDRLHRIGQKNAVQAYYLIAENTIEENVAGIVEAKRRIVEQATDGTIPKSSITKGLVKSLVKGGRR